MHHMVPFDPADWASRGFGSFVAIRRLPRPEPPQLPVARGVYVVLLSSPGRPGFRAASGGGHWKGKDPTVPQARLEREWVEQTATLYIGRATSLRERVGELLRFSDGLPVRHWGGRLLWQLEGCQDFLLGWRESPDFVSLEADLIDNFVEHFRRLPFANLMCGNRR